MKWSEKTQEGCAKRDSKARRGHSHLAGLRHMQGTKVHACTPDCMRAISFCNATTGDATLLGCLRKVVTAFRLRRAERIMQGDASTGSAFIAL